MSLPKSRVYDISKAEDGLLEDENDDSYLVSGDEELARFSLDDFTTH